MARDGLVRGTITRMVIRNITKLATGTTTRIITGNSTELVTETTTKLLTGDITELVIGTITRITAGTTGFTETIITIRTTAIPITDLTTNHTITVMGTTLTSGFTSLPTEPGSISDSAFDAAQAVRMMVVQIFSFAGRRLNITL
jgi:hypothetical protein